MEDDELAEEYGVHFYAVGQVSGHGDEAARRTDFVLSAIL
jgi:hypothetical protein